MFGVSVTVTSNRKVETAAEKAAPKNFGHAAARIRKEAVQSIVKSKTPAPEGEPLRTRRGLIRRAHRYAAYKEGAVIGTVWSRMGDAGQVQFGGTFRGSKYPARPVIVPALEKHLDSFVADWRGTIGD